MVGLSGADHSSVTHVHLRKWTKPLTKVKGVVEDTARHEEI